MKKKIIVFAGGKEILCKSSRVRRTCFYGNDFKSRRLYYYNRALKIFKNKINKWIQRDKSILYIRRSLSCPSTAIKVLGDNVLSVVKVCDGGNALRSIWTDGVRRRRHRWVMHARTHARRCHSRSSRSRLRPRPHSSTGKKARTMTVYPVYCRIST